MSHDDMSSIPASRTADPLAVGAALAAALRTGVIAELIKGPATEPELVERLRLDVRATRLLLDLLETLRYVRRDGDRVGLGDALLALVDRPGGFALNLFMWGHLETFVRTGEPFVTMDQSAPDREQAYRGVVGGLATMFEPLATDLAARVPVQPRTILDVGCGSGVWSLAIAQRHPEAHVTGLDLPAVLANFTARAAALALSPRTHAMPGDMHEAELPAGSFDLAIIANVLRLEPPDRAARVVERVTRAIAPGGSLLVVDALGGGSPDADRERAQYALHLGLRTRTGEVHSVETITRWCEHAGLPQVTALQIPNAGSVGALLATTP